MCDPSNIVGIADRQNIEKFVEYMRNWGWFYYDLAGFDFISCERHEIKKGGYCDWGLYDTRTYSGTYGVDHESGDVCEIVLRDPHSYGVDYSIKPVDSVVSATELLSRVWLFTLLFRNYSFDIEKSALCIWEDHRKIAKAYYKEKPSLFNDPHLALYWLMLFGFSMDDRYHEVKAIITENNLVTEIPLMQPALSFFDHHPSSESIDVYIRDQSDKDTLGKLFMARRNFLIESCPNESVFDVEELGASLVVESASDIEERSTKVVDSKSIQPVFVDNGITEHELDQGEQPDTEKDIEDRFYDVIHKEEIDHELLLEFCKRLQERGDSRAGLILLELLLGGVEFDYDQYGIVGDVSLDQPGFLSDSEETIQETIFPLTEDQEDIVHIEWRFGFVVSIELIEPPSMGFDDAWEDIGLAIGSSKLRSLYEIKLCEYSELEDIPYWIKDCPQIKKLTLNDNTITEIPDWIGELKNLEYLDISSNHLSTISDSIGRLTKLKELNLAKNRLEHIPSSLCHLKRLTSLDLSDNNLAALPECVVNMPQLKTLAVNDNFLSGFHGLPDRFELGNQTSDPIKQD